MINLSSFITMVVVLTGSACLAQFAVTSPNSEILLTFDEDQLGIYQVNVGNQTQYSLLEPEGWTRSKENKSKPSSLLPEGASVKSQYGEPRGSSSKGSASLFGDDYNQNGSRTEQHNFFSTLPGVEVNGNTVNSSNALRLSKETDRATNAVFLRILNQLNSPVNTWKISFDILYSDTDENFSIPKFGYAVDNGLDPDLMSFTEYGEAPPISNTSGTQVLAGTISYTINASVKNQDYLVLSFRDDGEKNKGSTIHIDNISITAAPGPPSKSYSEWAKNNGIPGASPTDDFDKDGFCNLLEYAIDGLNPTIPEKSIGRQSQGKLTFKKRPEAFANGDVGYSMETSTDASPDADWKTVKFSEPMTYDDTTITYTFPNEPEETYVRLKIIGN